MKLFRKALFWSHLAVGVIAGLVILIMSVTGVLLTYERQITYWADTRNYQIAPPSPDATRLSIDALLAKTREAQPGAAVTTITARSGASDPVAIGLAANPAGPGAPAGPGGGRTIFIDPYTGAVLGEGAKGVRDFFHVMTDWHRWLGARGASRSSARAVTGACNLGFLFIVASGIYLWWPRKRNWAQFRNILWFKRGLPGKARDFNWHNVIGFCFFVPLFIVTLSAVVISYQWANNLVYRAVGENPPVGRGPGLSPGSAGVQRGEMRRGGMERRDVAPQEDRPLDNLNAYWARAAQQVPGWRIVSLRLPTSPDAPLMFTIDQGDGGQPHKRAQLTLDRKSGEVMRWEPFSSNTPGRRLRSFLRFAHTGEVAGLAGQTIAGLASLGGVFLFYTGIALALRRLREWLKRRSHATAQTPAPATETAAD
ncbi:MAG TPA: PepSY-associated TM helix domain-containing protein [Blastocatellia bacterium]|nr:PepSY-associated TM helix domain-containing protein [Blastocatellia bacterium]